MNKNYLIYSKTAQKSSISKFTNDINFGINDYISPSNYLWNHYLKDEYNFLHCHNCIEFGITYEGTGIFHINEKNIRFSGPTASIIFPNVYHSASKTNFGENIWNFIYINQVDLLDKDSLKIFARLSGAHLVFSKKENPNLFQTIEIFIKLAAEDIKNKKEVLSNLFRSIIYLVVPLVKRTVINEDFGEILDAINYINMNYSEQIYNKELAKICNMSVSTLRRKFISITGLTPYAYVEKVRLSIAKSLLLSDNKIETIAYKCGYNTISCFNKKFKTVNGMSPKVYQLKKKIEN